MLSKEELQIIKDIWKLIDQYKQYPIGNRGLAAFYGTEIMDPINKFRDTEIKDASIIDLYNNIERIFADLEVSEDYLMVKNQPYLKGALASLLSCLTIYPHSKNHFGDKYKAMVEAAEAFALWGTGRCENTSHLTYLLLAASNIRPIRTITLQCQSDASAHALVLIGGEKKLNSDNFYNGDGFIVDYWSGCMGIASDLFKADGALHSFCNRKVIQDNLLDDSAPALPAFTFPKKEHLKEIKGIVEAFYQKFILFLRKTNEKTPSPAQNPFGLFASKYQKSTTEIDFLEVHSCYAIPNDAYDEARAANAKTLT